MALPFWKVKLFNLVIGVICFGLALYNFSNASPQILTEVDTCGVILSALVIIEAVLGGLCCKKMGDCCCYFCYKCSWSFVLAVTGAATILEALTFWQNEHRSCFDQQWHENLLRNVVPKDVCQYTEIRIAVGILLCVNGLAYLIANPEQRNPRRFDNRVLLPHGIAVNPSYVSGRPGGRTTTVVVSPSGTTASVVNIHNTRVAQPLIPSTRPEPQSQNIGQRPLPSLPDTTSDLNTRPAAYEPTAPPPPYFECPPPPYSTLPPNIQAQQGTTRQYFPV